MYVCFCECMATESRERDVVTNSGFILSFQDLDETLSERLWGLTEMFPEGVRNVTHSFFFSATTGIKGYLRFHSHNL